MTFTPSTFWQNETEYVDSLEEHVTPPNEDHRAVSYRALLGFDEHDYDGPDYEMAAPVISLDNMEVVFGHDSEARDQLPQSAVYIIRTHGLEFFERYVRIFHNGNVRQFHDYDGRRTYVTYDTAAMREAYWGADAGSEPSDLKSDFESWINGETFWVAVEHTFEYDEQGEPVWDNAIEDERTHGFYGTLYAQQEAEEMLDHYTSGDAPEKALAAHRRDTSLTVERTIGDAGWPIGTVEHSIARVTVYENVTCDGERYLVIDIDNETDDPDDVRVYLNDAPVYGHKEK